MAPEYGLILAPGAGGSSDSPALLAINRAARAGVEVHRFDFDYRLAGRKAPDRAPVMIDRVCRQVEELQERTGIPPERIFAGGRSMGGRMCSMAAAGGLVLAGLVLLSYPLHPPGRPEKLRTEHFHALGLPCLFVSGTRDAFGTPDELNAQTTTIPGPVEMHWIEGADHAMKKHDEAVAGVVWDWFERMTAAS